MNDFNDVINLAIALYVVGFIGLAVFLAISMVISETVEACLNAWEAFFHPPTGGR